MSCVTSCCYRPSCICYIHSLPVEALSNGNAGALEPHPFAAHSMLTILKPRTVSLTLGLPPRGLRSMSQANALLADPLPGGRGPREEAEDRYTPPDEEHGWLISR